MRPPYVLLFWLLSLSACAHRGPRVKDIVPPHLEKRLQTDVKEPKAAGVEALVVYGDSLSDPGNLSENSFGFLLPHDVYYEGHFSNGPVWAHYVEAATQWKVYNYAVAGALTYPSEFPESLLIPSFPEQVEDSEDRLEKLSRKSTLIAMWIGPNNYLRNGGAFETASGKTRPDLLAKGVDKTLSAIEDGIRKVYAKGFRLFMIGTMPELSGINRSPKDGRTATDPTLLEATRLHNAGLKTRIERLLSEKPDLRIRFFQANDINRQTYERPSAFAFTVLDKPCFEGSVTGEFYFSRSFCKDPMGYKFWEYLHPNTMMHCYYAAQFLDDLAAAQWIGGFSKEKALANCKGIRALQKAL